MAFCSAICRPDEVDSGLFHLQIEGLRSIDTRNHLLTRGSTLELNLSVVVWKSALE